MPRWHDFPVLWLGLQLAAFFAWVGLVRWLWPDISNAWLTVLGLVGLGLIAIAAVAGKRALNARPATERKRR